jgi:hypothetical protein
MTSITELEQLRLDRGSHHSFQEGHCLLELVSVFAREPFTDAPTCVSPVLRTYGMALNDQWDDEQRQLLKPFIPRMVGTAGDGLDETRSYLALDWLIRTYTPAWLDLAGLTEVAAELRALRQIVDMVAAEAAGPVVRKSRDQAGDAAGAAAGAAARAAARAAAGDAAGAAAGVAAWAAAGDAAWAAARDAARDAAWAAARDALKPTVERLQSSAIDLFDRMVKPVQA